MHATSIIIFLKRFEQFTANKNLAAKAVHIPQTDLCLDLQKDLHFFILDFKCNLNQRQSEVKKRIDHTTSFNQLLYLW